MQTSQNWRNWRDKTSSLSSKSDWWPTSTLSWSIDCPLKEYLTTFCSLILEIRHMYDFSLFYDMTFNLRFSSWDRNWIYFHWRNPFEFQLEVVACNTCPLVTRLLQPWAYRKIKAIGDGYAWFAHYRPLHYLYVLATSPVSTQINRFWVFVQTHVTNRHNLC